MSALFLLAFVDYFVLSNSCDDCVGRELKQLF